MAQLEKAKVFMSGRSQAVRIPAQFRFTSNEVYTPFLGQQAKAPLVAASPKKKNALCERKER
jgi:hypothetical protein